VRNVKLFIGSSLDGYIAREDGFTDWLYTDSDYGYTQFYDSVDAIMMGRITYDKFLHSGMEYAHKDKKTFVFTQKSSGKTKGKGDNVHFIEDVIEFAKELVQSPGKDIWLVGGADIISIFLNAEIVNEIILSMHPIVLGKGIPLFKNIQRQLNLTLVKSIPYQNGLMQLYYKPGY
jgi:dihydrofolate reductase